MKENLKPCVHDRRKRNTRKRDRVLFVERSGELQYGAGEGARHHIRSESKSEEGACRMPQARNRVIYPWTE